MCRKCVRPDSRPRRPSGLAIYLLAARPGRTGSAAGRAPWEPDTARMDTPDVSHPGRHRTIWNGL